MEIFLNGVKTPTQASTLSELIAEQSIATAGLAVAIGLRVIRRDEWDATPVADQAGNHADPRHTGRIEQWLQIFSRNPRS